MVADGGTKMDLPHQKKWVEELLLPKYFFILTRDFGTRDAGHVTMECPKNKTKF
jgi:hypothetical protein